ncbi:MAG: hypothetical protein IKY43_07220 [Bacteroidales bacterium]|nr:hypothetical protein [Bacteroidales bacterium]
MITIKKTIKALFVLVALLATTACGKEDVMPQTNNNKITTNVVRNIYHHEAKCITTVEVSNINNYSQRGVCWNTMPNPTLKDWNTVLGKINGNQAVTLSELSRATKYYVRAYIVGKSGNVYYGNEIDFTTPDAEAPNVRTIKVTDVKTNGATIVGDVIYDGGASIKEKGFCWNTSPNPTINDNYKANDQDSSSYQLTITGLGNGTTYYVRAYANNGHHIGYGEELKFTTNGFIVGREYADLGLPSGLKWATYNVGAAHPEQYGNYYAWGEISTKSEYTQENSVTYGQPMNDISGDPTYDVARASGNWGSTWRMPTNAEMQELINNCIWIWTTLNGVGGYMVTGPNGSSIFLPVAGYCDGSSLNGVGKYGYYWSSTPNESNDHNAYYLYFRSSNLYVHWGGRYRGPAVRPVSD